jgi:hypothetical protein
MLYYKYSIREFLYGGIIMIVKREKIYYKKATIIATDIYKRTSWWLLGIIPLYIKNEFIQRKY